MNEDFEEKVKVKLGEYLEKENELKKELKTVRERIVAFQKVLNIKSKKARRQ